MNNEREPSARDEPLEYEECDVPEGMTIEEYRRSRSRDEPRGRDWLRGLKKDRKQEESR